MKHNARSVFINKWGRYSIGEKIAIVYCTILGLLFIIAPIIRMSPIDSTSVSSFGLLNIYLLKTGILIFASWIALLLWSTSYRFKAFIHHTIGFKENDSLFSLFLLIVLTIGYIAIGDVTLLLKNNITYTMSLTNWYFLTSLLLLAGIVYTLRRGIAHARRLSKAPIRNTSPIEKQDEEDIESLRDHLSTPGGLF